MFNVNLQSEISVAIEGKVKQICVKLSEAKLRLVLLQTHTHTHTVLCARVCVQASALQLQCFHFNAHNQYHARMARVEISDVSAQQIVITIVRDKQISYQHDFSYHRASGPQVVQFSQ